MNKLKSILNNIKKGGLYIIDFLTDVFLAFLSVGIVVILAVWGIPEIIVDAFYKKHFLKGLAKFGDIFRIFALLVDMFGHFIIQVPANRLLITKDGYRAGNWRDTFSYFLGMNVKKGTLTPTGIKVVYYVDYFFGKDHCINATDLTNRQ